jgi:hypothetical protein
LLGSNADEAQPAVRRSCKAEVAGSSPAVGSTRFYGRPWSASRQRSTIGRAPASYPGGCEFESRRWLHGLGAGVQGCLASSPRGVRPPDGPRSRSGRMTRRCRAAAATHTGASANPGKWRQHRPSPRSLVLVMELARHAGLRPRCQRWRGGSTPSEHTHADVAQQVRAPVRQTGGRGFEPRRWRNGRVAERSKARSC